MIKTIAAAAGTIVLIGAVAVGMFSLGKYSDPGPRSDDFMTASVYVEDAAPGEDPRVRVEREVHRVFRAQWTAEITDEVGAHMCSGSGYSIYRPDDTLPEDIRLFAWWLFAPDPASKCVPGEYPLKPGKCYRVNTIWDARAVVIVSESNLFCIGEDQ